MVYQRRRLARLNVCLIVAVTYCDELGAGRLEGPMGFQGHEADDAVAKYSLSCRRFMPGIVLFARIDPEVRVTSSRLKLLKPEKSCFQLRMSQLLSITTSVSAILASLRPQHKDVATPV